MSLSFNPGTSHFSYGGVYIYFNVFFLYYLCLLVLFSSTFLQKMRAGCLVLVRPLKIGQCNDYIDVSYAVILEKTQTSPLRAVSSESLLYPRRSAIKSAHKSLPNTWTCSDQEDYLVFGSKHIKEGVLSHTPSCSGL